MQEYQRRALAPDAQVESFAIVGYQGLHEKSLAPLLIVPVAAVNWRCSRSAHESCGLIPVIDGLHAITGAMKGHLLAERPDQREPATEHRIIRG